MTIALMVDKRKRKLVFKQNYKPNYVKSRIVSQVYRGKGGGHLSVENSKPRNLELERFQRPETPAHALSDRLNKRGLVSVKVADS